MAEFEKRDDSFAFHGEMRAISKSASALDSILEDEVPSGGAKLEGIKNMMWTKVSLQALV